MSTGSNINGIPVVTDPQTVQDGDILVYNSSTQQWEAGQAAGGGGGAPQAFGAARRTEIDDTLLGVEVKLGGFYFNPNLFSGSTYSLATLVTLTDGGGLAPTLDLRLYDLGDPNVPIAPIQRAFFQVTTTGTPRWEDTLLTATPVISANGDILNVPRMYEVRAELNGDVGDLAEIDWAGIQGIS